MARWNEAQRLIHIEMGTELQRLRSQHEMTFREVSEVSGLAVHTIFQLEVGALAPRLDHLVDLHKAYGTKLTEAVVGIITKEKS